MVRVADSVGACGWPLLAGSRSTDADGIAPKSKNQTEATTTGSGWGLVRHQKYG